MDEGSSVTLQPEDLKAEDPDTDDMLLTFQLEEAPVEGLLLVDGQQTDRFTQADLQEGFVEYQVKKYQP